MIKKLILLIFGFSIVTHGFAHPPDKINLEFNQKNNTFKVVSEHNSKDVLKHYISKITVIKNNEKIIEQIISKQENPASQTVTYTIPDLLPGDKIKVISQCNVFGKKEEIFITYQVLLTKKNL